MLHPALSRALATARIEDLHRAATPRETIRLQQGGLIRLKQGGLIRLQQGWLIHLKQGGLKPRESQAGVRRK